MRRKIGFAISFSLMFLLLDPSSLLGGKPVIKFDDMVFNFGEAPQHDSLVHIFKFKNAGDDTLIISKVRSTCGCTAALLSNDTIAPGDSGQIKATFKTGSFKGNVTRRIIVYSNDPDLPSARLTISGQVYTLVDVEPTRIMIRKFKVDSSLVETIKVLPGRAKAIRVEDITTSFPDQIKIKSYPIEEKGKKGAMLEVKIGPGLPEGRIVSYVKAKAYIDESKEPYPINVTITGNVVGPVDINPSILATGAVKMGDSITKVVNLKSTEGHWIEVKEIDTGDIRGLVVDSIVRKAEDWVRIHFTYKPKGFSGVVQGNVTIKTNISEKPEIKIPFYSRVLAE